MKCTLKKACSFVIIYLAYVTTNGDGKVDVLYYDKSNSEAKFSICGASLIKLRYKEKGFLKRAANAAGRLLFNVDTTQYEEPVNKEKIPVGLFPDPNVLAEELDQLENRKIKKDSNEVAVNYVEDRLKGSTPNAEFLSSGAMGTISSGALERGSSEEVKIAKKASTDAAIESREREQSLQSQGQIIKQGDKLKVGKKGPVTIDDPDSDKKGKTTPPKLVVVDEESEFTSEPVQTSLINNPFVIITLFILVVAIFSAGGLIFFKKLRKK